MAVKDGNKKGSKSKKHKNSFIDTLEQLQTIVDDTRTYTDALDTVFYASENKFYNTIFLLIDLYMVKIAKIYKIHEAALSWFIYDNDFGRQKLQVGTNGVDSMQTIDSIEKFWDYEKS